MWNGHKYIFWGPITGEKIDPFLWKTSFSKRLVGDRTLALDRGDYDALFDNFLLDQPFQNYLKELYTSEVFGLQTVLQDSRFLVTDQVEAGEYEITFKEALLRNEAIKWGLYRWSRSEAFLRERGYIMMSASGRGCVPVDLVTANPLDLPAKSTVVPRAIHEINNLSATYGKDFFTKEGFQRSGAAISLTDPRFLGLVAKRLLDLYGVRLHWNEGKNQYEIIG